jgi:hypothetical protein
VTLTFALSQENKQERSARQKMENTTQLYPNVNHAKSHSASQGNKVRHSGVVINQADFK